ncbi:hypothetical protein [uncultured Brachyspira sp.]|nr:hypothetical protein [uncultured Brachyspira sp.]
MGTLGDLIGGLLGGIIGSKIEDAIKNGSSKSEKNITNTKK